MKKNNLISRNDYERYMFPLPLGIILKGKKKSFIYSELEKRHPCFSADCFLDTKFKLNNKKIMSDVVVINKLQLAEYAKLNTGKMFYLENSDGKRRIQIKGSGNGKYLLMFFLIGLCVTAGSLLETNSESKNKKNQSVLSSEFLDAKEHLSMELGRTEIVNNFLNELETLGGKLSSVEWYSDGYKEQFIAKVENVFPQDLSFVSTELNITGVDLGKIKVSTVAYRNGIPEFTLSLDDCYEEKDSVEKEELSVARIQSFFKNDSFCKSVRMCMKAYGVEPVEEIVNPFSVKFSCKEYQELEHSNFLIAMNELSKFNKFAISRVRIQRIDNQFGTDGFSGEIQFSSRILLERGINLESLGWRPNLLINQRKFKTTEQVITNSKSLDVQNENSGRNLISGRKLGEIKHADGSLSIFYRDEKGKIKCQN